MRHFVAVAVLSIMVIAGCGESHPKKDPTAKAEQGSGDSAAGKANDTEFTVVIQDAKIESTPLDAPDVEEVRVDWKPEVMQLSQEETKAHAKDITLTEDGEVTLVWQDAATDFTKGQAFFAENFGIYRVKSVDSDSDGQKLVLEVAPLADVATHADLSFDKKITFDAGFAGEQGLPLVAIPIEGEIKMGPTTLAIEVEKDGDAMNLKGSAQYEKGPAAIQLGFDITLQPIRMAGKLQMVEGDLKNFNLLLGNLAVTGKLNIKTSNNINFLKDLGKLPVEFRIPAVIGGIPVFLKIGADFHFAVKSLGGAELDIAAEISAEGATLLDNNGEGDVADVKRDLTQTANMPVQKVVNSAFEITFVFPRIGVGVGTWAASAEVFVKQGFRFGRGLAYKTRPFQKPRPEDSCLRLDTTVFQAVGGEISLLGLKFSKEKQLSAREHVFLEKGGACKEFLDRAGG